MYKQGKYPIVSKKTLAKGILTLRYTVRTLQRRQRQDSLHRCRQRAFSSADLSLFAISTRTRVLSALF